jgi:hypothetical protein
LHSCSRRGKASEGVEAVGVEPFVGIESGRCETRPSLLYRGSRHHALKHQPRTPVPERTLGKPNKHLVDFVFRDRNCKAVQIGSDHCYLRCIYLRCSPARRQAINVKNRASMASSVGPTRRASNSCSKRGDCQRRLTQRTGYSMAGAAHVARAKPPRCPPPTSSNAACPSRQFPAPAAQSSVGWSVLRKRPT